MFGGFMVGNQIRELRIKKKLKRTDLAKLLNVSGATISMWENGQRRPDIEKLAEIAKLFNVTIDWLVDSTDASFELKLPKTENTITIMGRNGTFKTYVVDDSQIKTLRTFTDTLIGSEGDNNDR